jgi:hypothetical protein
MMAPDDQEVMLRRSAAEYAEEDRMMEMLLSKA